MLRGADAAKDQSYFLHRLTQTQLARQLFPLGSLAKHQVRQLAREFGLAVADKADSQDFYTGDRSELIGAANRPGDIVDEAGNILGKHTGFWKFTIGQRKGLRISHPRPLYVVSLDAQTNRVVIAEVEGTIRTSLTASDFNWVSIPPPSSKTTLENISIKVRSAGDPVPGVTALVLDDSSVRAIFPAGISGVVPGQSAVLYDGDIVLGGGVIM